MTAYRRASLARDFIITSLAALVAGLAIILAFIAAASLFSGIPVAAQTRAPITVRGDLQSIPVRGAVAVITVPGLDLPGRAALTLKGWPLNLDGVSVSIEGLLCPIRGYSGDSIAFLVPEDAPRSHDWRKRSVTVRLTTPAGVFETEMTIFNVFPGLAKGANAEGYGEEATYPAGVWRMGINGRIGVFTPSDPILTSPSIPTVMQVWGSGVRFAFGRGAVLAQLECGARTITAPASVALGFVDGLDAITFTLPKDAAGAGRCQLRVLAGERGSEARVIDIQ
jgi:uncharacterized protein (TIGR03437 family)